MSQEVVGEGACWKGGGGGWGGNQLTGTWAREQGLRVGRVAGGNGGWIGRDQGRRTGGRGRGGGGYSTTDPEAGAGCKCRTVRGRPRAGAETSGKTIS